MLGARPAGGTEFSVASLAEYLARVIGSDDLLRRVRVHGEVTNYKDNSRGGTMHFDLKEGDALLKCFAWAEHNVRFPAFSAGTKIVASGRIATYSRQSAIQLVVDKVEIAGVGDAHALFEQRKKKLAAAGLFDAARKRPLPAFPFRIALVSSKGAAGAGDFVSLMRAGRPHVQIVWCEATMQGASAPPQIVGALGRASRLDVDAIVLTRGGGSFEDLFIFSDESIVRAVVDAKHPVISAVGHNIDLQLCDLAADVHAATPSRAVELIGPETRALVERVSATLERARRSTRGVVDRQTSRLAGAVVRSRLSDPGFALLPQHQRLDGVRSDFGVAFARDAQARRDRLAALERRLLPFDPSLRLAQRERRLQDLGTRLGVAAHARRNLARARLDLAVPRLAPAARALLERAAQRRTLLETRLRSSDPDTILQKGYAIVTLGGAVVKDVAAVPLGATIAARVARGTLSARVETKEADGHERIG
jgi:exodeoxyribonuclease VII large subunit